MSNDRGNRILKALDVGKQTDIEDQELTDALKAAQQIQAARRAVPIDREDRPGG